MASELLLFYVEGQCCADPHDSDLRGFVVAACSKEEANAMVDRKCRRIWKKENGRGPLEQEYVELGAEYSRCIGRASARMRKPQVVVDLGTLTG